MQARQSAPSSRSPAVTTGAAIVNLGAAIFLAANHAEIRAVGFSVLAAMLLIGSAVTQWYLYARAYVAFSIQAPQAGAIDQR